MTKGTTKSTPQTVVVALRLAADGTPTAGKFEVKDAALEERVLADTTLTAAILPVDALGPLIGKVPIGSFAQDEAPALSQIDRPLFDDLLKIVSAVPGPSDTAAERPTMSPTRLELWDEIQVGAVVIAHDSPDDGWWEARVAMVQGDVLTLTWRDYPEYPSIRRRRTEVALLFPGLTS